MSFWEIKDLFLSTPLTIIFIVICVFIFTTFIVPSLKRKEKLEKIVDEFISELSDILKSLQEKLSENTEEVKKLLEEVNKLREDIMALKYEIKTEKFEDIEISEINEKIKMLKNMIINLEEKTKRRISKF